MISFFVNAIRLAATFLFGSTGETVTEKSGHLNLGIPGIMCVGAAGGYLGEVIYIKTLNGNIANANWFLAIIIPVIFALVFSGVLGLLFSFLVVSLRANQNITGLSISTFGIGFSKFIISTFKPEVKELVPSVAKNFSKLFTFYEKLGAFGKLFLSYGILVYLSIAIAILASIFLKKSRVGLELRAVGESTATADAAGINVNRYRYIATIIGSAIAGLGGLSFTMDYLVGEWEYCIDALGWLAVALVIFTVWKPNIGIFGSILFACLYVAPGYIHSATSTKELIKMLPYAVTIIILIITSIVGHKSVQPPANLGINYFREDR